MICVNKSGCLGIAHVGGWGVVVPNACQDGLGHLFREVQMGICLVVGGLKCLPGWFGALMQ